MKAAISGWLIGALLVLCNTIAFAQTNPPVSGATLVGTFSGVVHIGEEEPTLEGNIADAYWDAIAWLTSGGETVISINVNSMTFSNPCAWAQTISLKTLMDNVGKSSIARAIQLGFLTCMVCPSTTTVKIYYPTCVERNITGSCPVLTAAPGSTFSYNLYSFCCTAGVPTVSYISSTCGSGSCGSGYELTCW